MARRAALLAAALVPALATSAAADTVTTLDDSGPGSLRAAIASTAAGGTVTFEPGLQGTILLADQLTIDKDLTIDGPSAQQLAISGNDATRVFQIFGPDTDVTIDDVTIRDGRADADEPIGAGVWFIQGDGLTLRRVAVLSNEAVDMTGVVTPLGAGITVFDGRLELHETTVADNHAVGGTGGAVFVGTPATFAVSNSTIAGNEARGGAGIVSANAEGTITASTVAGNEAGDQPGGGVFASGPAVVTLTRSLLSQNTAAAGADCQGELATGGGNVIAANCLAAPAASDATGVTAAVGPLGAHGGPTATVLPLAGNPAIDHIATCAGADQRAVARPQGAGCDAGAVELRSARLTASGGLALGAAQVGQQTATASATVTNDGERGALITGVALTGAADIAAVAAADSCENGTVLDPGDSCRLQARLKPTSAGAKQATFTVSFGTSALDVPVTGHGHPAPVTPPPGGGASPAPAVPQPTVTPSAEAVLLGARTKARRGGKLKLRLRCTTVVAPRCAGRLTLRLGARRLARAFSIAAGRKALVTLKLGARDRRRLARKRSLRSAVTVVTTQPDGSRRTTHQGTFKLLRS